MDRKNQKCDIRGILKYSKKRVKKKLNYFFLNIFFFFYMIFNHFGKKKVGAQKRNEKVRTCICTYM